MHASNINRKKADGCVTVHSGKCDYNIKVPAKNVWNTFLPCIIQMKTINILISEFFKTVAERGLCTFSHTAVLVLVTQYYTEAWG